MQEYSIGINAHKRYSQITIMQENYLKKYETRMEDKRDIFEYIEIFYNNRERLHSFLGYNIPEEYEKMIMVA